MEPKCERWERPLFYAIFAAAAAAGLPLFERAHWPIAIGQYVAAGIALGAIEWAGSRGTARRPELPVRRPGFELLLVLVPAVAGGALLFIGHTTNAGLFKLLALPLVFPVIPSAVLLLRRYRLFELGFAPRGLVLAPIVYGLSFAAASCTVTGGSPLLDLSFAEFLGYVLPGFFLAALPEEVFRLLCYTRLRPFLRSTPVCLLVASLLWSALHFPTWYVMKGGDAPAAAANIVKLLPTGLLWGYMIHRTGSLWPSLLVHALPRPVP